MSLGDLLNVMCSDDDVSIYTVGRMLATRSEKIGDGTVGDLREVLNKRHLDLEVVHISWFDVGLMILVECLQGGLR